MPIAELLLATALLAWAIAVLRRPARYKLPPGPPGYPVVGNFFDVPRQKPQDQYQKCLRTTVRRVLARSSCARAERLIDSDIIALDLMGTTMVMLNSAKAAEGFLAK